MKLSRGSLICQIIIKMKLFHDLKDNIFVAGSENDEMFEDAPLDFDPAYPPLEKMNKKSSKGTSSR